MLATCPAVRVVHLLDIVYVCPYHAPLPSRLGGVALSTPLPHPPPSVDDDDDDDGNDMLCVGCKSRWCCVLPHNHMSCHAVECVLSCGETRMEGITWGHDRHNVEEECTSAKNTGFSITVNQRMNRGGLHKEHENSTRGGDPLRDVVCVRLPCSRQHP